LLETGGTHAHTHSSQHASGNCFEQGHHPTNFCHRMQATDKRPRPVDGSWWRLERWRITHKICNIFGLNEPLCAPYS